MHRVVVLASLAAACGRHGFDARGDAAADAAPDAQQFARCSGTLIFDDEFDAPGAGPVFMLNTGTEIPATEVGGELVFDLSGAITGRQYRAYRSVTTYPLDGLCLVAEVTSIATCEPCGTYLKIYDTAQAAELYAYRGPPDELSMRTHVNAIMGSGTVEHFFDIPFDLVNTRFWQIRHVGTATYWETSADGLAFTRHTQKLDLFTESAVSITLGAGTPVSTSNGGIASFQRVTAYGP